MCVYILHMHALTKRQIIAWIASPLYFDLLTHSLHIFIPSQKRLLSILQPLFSHSMGNCAASRLAAGDEDAVALCRDRKTLLKSAVDCRYALADAHSNYIHSLSGVAAAIGMFVARHSSPDSILIALPAPVAGTEPAFLRQTPTEAKLEALELEKPVSAPVSEEEGEEKEGGSRGMGYGYYVGEVAPVVGDGGFGWDFFNPFNGMVGGLRGCSEEELRAVREEEGIPELEDEDEVKKGGIEGENNAEVVKVETEEQEEEEEQEKGLTVMGAPEKERELLEALRNVEDQFIRAYDAGKEVSRMLEASQVQFQSGVDGIKGDIFFFQFLLLLLLLLLSLALSLFFFVCL